MWINKFEIPGDNIDNDGNGYIDDYKGLDFRNDDGNIYYAKHGTGVAGIIGATGNNNKGISGINWKIKILPITSIKYTILTQMDVSNTKPIRGWNNMALHPSHPTKLVGLTNHFVL